MTLVCRVRMRTVKVEIIEAPMEAWRRKGGQIVFTEDTNGSGEGKDGHRT